MALISQPTFNDVKGSKSASKAVRESFRRIFSKWLQDEHGGNQTAAGKALHMTQSHVSGLQSGTRGPGIDLLIRLRVLTKLTIDQLLGLDPLPQVFREDDYRRISREEYAKLRAAEKALDNDGGDAFRVNKKPGAK